MLPDRFKEKIDTNQNTECWLWTGAKQSDGYGVVGHENKIYLAHRKIYEILVGKIPEGLELDHKCRNRSCVNPAHLEPVTHKENVLRGKSPSAKNSIKTHCNNGHKFTDENTANPKNKKGVVYRRCRICARKSKNDCMARLNLKKQKGA